MRHADDLCPYLLERRQINLLVTLHIDAVDAPVLVAALILQKQNVLAVISPVVLANTAFLVVSDGLGGIELAERRQPDIEHAILRSEERHVAAVRAQASLRANRVAEQGGTGNQMSCRLTGGHSQTSTKSERGQCGAHDIPKTQSPKNTRAAIAVQLKAAGSEKHLGSARPIRANQNSVSFKGPGFCAASPWLAIVPRELKN